MDYVLKDLEPKKMWRFFEELTRIPHGSYNEKQLSDWLVNFAKERGLKVKQDAAMNVLISKPATPGMENKKTIMIQAHMDMVCVKDEGVEHDFTKDPLPIYIDGDYVKSRGTSLGGDNGNGVSMMLTILDSDDIPHPNIQCIFTTAEEVGMTGASQLEPDCFEGEYLLNLDGGDDFTEMFLSCAGSHNDLYRFPKNAAAVANADEKVAYELFVGGINSGHSAFVIVNFGGNAIKQLGEVLSSLEEKFAIELATVKGGSKANVIAKEAKATVVVPKTEAAAFEAAVKELAAKICIEYTESDPEMFIELNPVAMPETVMEKEQTSKFIAFLDICQNGVFYFFRPEKDNPKTSSNMGILEDQGDVIMLTCMFRSNSDFLHDEYIRKLTRISKAFGVDHEVEGKSLAWEYRPDSDLVRMYSALVEKEYGVKPTHVIAHGGVEPGQIIERGKLGGKNIQAVVFGAASLDVHSTAERVYIPGYQKALDWMKKILVSLD
ncbi:MAG: beta-Ala-His dipeptidase [Christensenellaceae bacterium]|nr:beta-Ala-His dipeptidase [Christensenellaceae bacterium]